MTLDEMIESAILADGPSIVPLSRVSPGGIDPLGLRQINFALMDQVLPNLNNVARRLRPFVVLAWAWRRVDQIVHASGRGGETDELMRDFVDRMEAIYSWSQFLVDPSTDLPGRQALQPLIAGERYRFGGDEWIARRNLRRSSTGLISPLNYGPGIRMMGWLENSGPVGVFRANPELGPALDAFEGAIRDELDNPAFSLLGEVIVSAEDVRRWGTLWSLDGLTQLERDAGFDRLAGKDAPAERRSGLALVRTAHASIEEPDKGASEVRRRMATPLADWVDSSALASTAARWHRMQVRQVFRLALEGLLYWIIGNLDHGPLDSSTLARDFTSKVGQDHDLKKAAAWLHGLPKASNPLDHLEGLHAALASGSDIPTAIAEALAFCIEEAPAHPEKFERPDRLPLSRAAGQVRNWAGLSPEAFMVKVIETWVFAQHAYWCVGRGLADARGGGKTLLRLKVVMDEGGWTLTPGTTRGRPPIATGDRLESALGLLGDCGRLS